MYFSFDIYVTFKNDFLNIHLLVQVKAHFYKLFNKYIAQNRDFGTFE